RVALFDGGPAGKTCADGVEGPGVGRSIALCRERVEHLEECLRDVGPAKHGRNSAYQRSALAERFREKSDLFEIDAVRCQHHRLTRRDLHWQWLEKVLPRDLPTTTCIAELLIEDRLVSGVLVDEIDAIGAFG